MTSYTLLFKRVNNRVISAINKLVFFCFVDLKKNKFVLGRYNERFRTLHIIQV
jgi:hypothetical protein